MSFINFSNHDSSMWSKKQKEEAEKWGKIIDLPFPNVSAEMDEKDLSLLAEKCLQEILSYHPQAVMCQGEFTLVYILVNELKKRGITVLAACSQRRSREEIMADGSSMKSSVFEFVKFRSY